MLKPGYENTEQDSGLILVIDVNAGDQKPYKINLESKQIWRLNLKLKYLALETLQGLL